MAHLAGNPEAQQPGRNRLGRLFSSLVDGDTLPDVFSLFAEKMKALSILLSLQNAQTLI